MTNFYISELSRHWTCRSICWRFLWAGAEIRTVVRSYPCLLQMISSNILNYGSLVSLSLFFSFSFFLFFFFFFCFCFCFSGDFAYIAIIPREVPNELHIYNYIDEKWRLVQYLQISDSVHMDWHGITSDSPDVNVLRRLFVYSSFVVVEVYVGGRFQTNSSVAATFNLNDLSGSFLPHPMTRITSFSRLGDFMYISRAPDDFSKPGEVLI
jgi:hypothetical protein